MIFVTLGTQKQQFTRLLEQIENSSVLNNEEILIQNGYTKFESEKLKLIDFISNEEFNKNIDDCEFLITHGGIGSIFSALLLNKKVLAVPRLQKYKEHVDNHQLEICKKLESLGYILVLKEDEDFDIKIQLLREKNFEKYKSSDLYLNIIEKAIEEEEKDRMKKYYV